MKADKQSRLVPKLRFPEFRDDITWLAPQFADLYSFKRTNSLSRDQLNYENGTVRNIHYGDIHTKFKPLFRVAEEHVPYVNSGTIPNGFDENVFCEEGDIILADASEDLDDVGKAIEVVSLDGEDVVAGMHTILARRRGSVPVVGYGGQLFQSNVVRTGIKREAQGAKVYGISANRISAILLPIPPTEAEQQKIADCLGSLDALIAAEGEKLEALRRHKQGLMQQLFPQPGETVPRLRFPEFRDCKPWQRKKLGEAATFLNGRAYKKEELLESGTYKVLRVGNFFTSDHWYFSDLELDNDKYCDNGDLLYAWSASFGPRIWRGNRVIYHYHIWKVVERHDVYRHFLYACLDRETERMRAKSANGLGMMHLTKAGIEEWECAIPEDMEEQISIANSLSSLDDQITAQTRRIEALKAHKQGLLQQLFPSPEGNE